MNEDQLRQLLSQASEPAWDEDVRADSALYAGHRVVRRRRRHELVTGAVVLALAGAAGVAVLLPASSTPSATVALGCAQQIGSHGEGVVTGGVGGVTLAVTNPTTDLQSVTGPGFAVLAVPGTSQVTLPLSAGSATVRCGSGAPVRLTVQHLSSQAHCSSYDTSLEAGVEQGRVEDLTRRKLHDLPAGAVVSTSGSDPLQRVQVRSAGRVLAEALWHRMPGEDDWQLESLARCR